METAAARAAYALEGARDAVARIKTTYRPSDSRGASEAAFWIAALEGVLAAPSGGHKSGSAWAHKCRKAGVRDLLEGLRFVRNHAAHGLAHLPELGGGLTIPFTIPFTISVSMKWAAGDLPPLGKDEPASVLESYRVALAGQDVEPTLVRATTWLEAQVPK